MKIIHGYGNVYIGDDNLERLTSFREKMVDLLKGKEGVLVMGILDLAENYTKYDGIYKIVRNYNYLTHRYQILIAYENGKLGLVRGAYNFAKFDV